MLPSNPFILPDECYTRDIDILNHCHNDNAFYIHKETGDSFEDCLKFVRQATSAGGILPIKNPNSMVLCRDAGEDKDLREMLLSDFFETIVNRQYVFSPTLAVYCSTSEEESLVSKFMIGNTEKRSIAKKEMFEAGIAGDTFKEGFKNTEQTAKKLANNSLSGAQVSDSTPLYDKSAHSSLTTTCRTATSYGNAYNEGFIRGNRHYWCPDVVISHITTLARITDLVALQSIVDKYHLHLPTTAEMMAVIRYSTKFYNVSDSAHVDIESYVSKLDPIERAAFCYVNDLYHLNMFNRKLVHQLINRLAFRDTVTILENPDEPIKAMDDDLKALVGILCSEELMGTSIRDLKNDNPTAYNTVAATALNAITVLDRCRDLVSVLWMSDNMPITVASIRGIIRRAVTTSDTDSSIFTTQFWTQDILGKRQFGRDADRIAAAVTYLSLQGVAHVLIKMAANMGSDPKHYRRLGMKNEYHFPVFTITPRAKHYFALQGAREGNVFKKFKSEIKGVELRSSVVPAHVMAKQKLFIEYILKKAIADNTISLYDLFDEVSLIENDIINSVKRGGRNYMPSAKIKDIKSYKNPKSSNYNHYLLWQEVFAAKYGNAPDPEYTCIKVAIDADKPASMKRWVDSIEDPSIKLKLQNWLQKHDKKAMGQLLLPADIVVYQGIPAEIIPVIDLKRLIISNVSGFYLALEGLGIYMRDPNICRLISDEYTPRITESRLESVA